MDIDLSNLIDKALDYYDKHNIEYSKYIKSDNISLDRDKNIIKFNEVDDNKQSVFKYEFL